MRAHKYPLMVFITVFILISVTVFLSIIIFNKKTSVFSVGQGFSLLKNLDLFSAHVAHSPPSSSRLSPSPQSSTSDTGEKSEIQTVNCLTELMRSSLQCLEGELPNRGLSVPPPNPKTHICT